MSYFIDSEKQKLFSSSLIRKINSHISTVMYSVRPVGDPVNTGRRLILDRGPKFGKHGFRAILDSDQAQINQYLLFVAEYC